MRGVTAEREAEAQHDRLREQERAMTSVHASDAAANTATLKPKVIGCAC
jgi:hypothetical protein